MICERIFHWDTLLIKGELKLVLQKLCFVNFVSGFGRFLVLKPCLCSRNFILNDSVSGVSCLPSENIGPQCVHMWLSRPGDRRSTLVDKLRSCHSVATQGTQNAAITLLVLERKRRFDFGRGSVL